MLDVVPLPDVDGAVAKVEGLALLARGRVLAVVDEDDEHAPSSELVLTVSGI